MLLKKDCNFFLKMNRYDEAESCKLSTKKIESVACDLLASHRNTLELENHNYRILLRYFDFDFDAQEKQLTSKLLYLNRRLKSVVVFFNYKLSLKLKAEIIQIEIQLQKLNADLARNKIKK